MNIRTVGHLYPDIMQPRGMKPKPLTAVQVLTLHLLLNRRPDAACLFGPYIAVLPKDFSDHPLTWIIEGNHLAVLEYLPISVRIALNSVSQRFWADLDSIIAYTVRCNG